MVYRENEMWNTENVQSNWNKTDVSKVLGKVCHANKYCQNEACIFYN